MKDTLNFLNCIGSTEETTFGELCQALGDDCPEKGDRQGWASLFKTIKDAERAGLIEVSRSEGGIDGIILTPDGKDMILRRG